MAKRRGRPRNYDYDKLGEFIENHESDIFYRNDKGQYRIRAELHENWKILSTKLNDPRMNAHNLYCFVINDTGGFRSRSEKKIGSSKIVEDVKHISDDSLDISNNTINKSINSTFEEENFVISIPKEEIEKILERKTVVTKRNKDSSVLESRDDYCFKSHRWAPIIRKYFLERKPKTTCFIAFTNHRLHTNFTGEMNGKCSCGTIFKGSIHNFLSDNVLITVNLISKPTGKPCGKTYMNKEERMEVGKFMAEKNICPTVMLANEANKVQSGQKHPSTLYSIGVYANAKHDHKVSNYIHKNPFRSLELLAAQDLKEEIIFLSSNPFIVIYLVPHQLRSYKKYHAKRNSFVAADATGGPFASFLKAGLLKTKVIFLYEVVVKDSDKQYSTIQMLSEDHSTRIISFWLSLWIDNGAPQPKKFVCDESKAFLNAAIETFTNFRSINDYVNNLFNDVKPDCQIAIDFAHFMHKNAIFLSKSGRGVKRFLMSCLGHLILCTNKNDAANTLKNMLYLLFSVQAGKLPSGSNTKCERAIEFFNAKILATPILEIIEKDLTEDTEDETLATENMSTLNSTQATVKIQLNKLNSILTEAEIKNNNWCKWAFEIEKEVKESIKLEENKGDKSNPYEMPKFADYLIKNISLISLWGCIVHDVFNYDCNQSTSASVESDFNDVKNRMCRNMSKPMRVDEFILVHINYLKGKLFDPKHFFEKSDVDNALIENEDLLNVITQEHGVNPQEKQDRAPKNSKHQPKSPLQEEKKDSMHVHLEEHYESFSESQANFEPCPVCANGDHPGGAHKCLRCEKFVHALEPCSFPVPGEDEGYGQKRLCLRCHRAIQNTNDWAPQKESTPVSSVIIRKRDYLNDIEEKCIFCKQELPGDDHACVVCGSFVHPMEPCSFVVIGQTDGFQILRMCAQCNETTPEQGERILRRNVNEDWHGLVSKDCKKAKTKKSIYIKKHPPSYFSNLPKKEICILRNGNKKLLQLINVQGKDISLANTCAFDSMFQIFHVAYLDHNDVRVFISSNEEKIGLFKIVNTLGTTKQITAQTYKQRCMYLMEFFELRNFEAIGNYVLECRTTAARLITKMFLKEPSYQEIYKCQNGCENSPHCTYVVNVDRYVLKPDNKNNMKKQIIKENLENSIKQFIFLNTTKLCLNEGCQKPLIKTTQPGKVLFIESYDSHEYGDNTVVKVENLPNCLDLEIQGEMRNYKLLGIVQMINSVTRKIKKKNLDYDFSRLGHYTAIIKRCDDSFIRCDGDSDNQILVAEKLKYNYKFIPEILIYFLVK